MLVLTFAIDVHAELEEVRGILTKQEKRYVDNEKEYYFIFTNENDYPVWLDMEVYCESTAWGTKKYTKSITLQARETYEWYPGLTELPMDSYHCHTKYKAYKKQ